MRCGVSGEPAAFGPHPDNEKSKQVGVTKEQHEETAGHFFLDKTPAMVLFVGVVQAKNECR